jgi:pimeloyl-ACP methyl ester carboxylesterase
MSARPAPRIVPLLAATALLCLAPMASCPGSEIREERIDQPGFVQADTLGAQDAPAPSAALVALLGATPDLNRVTSQRSFILKPDGAPPRVVMILVPGFLGGASNFAPIARQLVQRFNGELQVWVVDRRPNQLEDRLGAAHALTGFPEDGPADPTRLVEGVQFYFADEGAFDVDQDGELDPAFPLEDAFGVERPFLRLEQDDVRFMAHWGLDTYARDWKILVDEARALVGEDGLVLFGGHSMGTGWTARFAAYDFDSGPGVDAGFSHLDGLLLLEGGGAEPPSENAPTFQQYLDTVAALEAPGGPDVYLSNFSGIDIPSLGAAAELAGIAGLNLPDEESILQRTPIFGSFPLGIVLGSPASNEAVVGLFIDDDFSSIGAFRASVGFTANGPNVSQPGLFGGPPFYIAAEATAGGIPGRGDRHERLPRAPVRRNQLRRVVLLGRAREPRLRLRPRFERARRRAVPGSHAERERGRSGSRHRRLERPDSDAFLLRQLPGLHRDAGSQTGGRDHSGLRPPRRHHRE